MITDRNKFNFVTICIGLSFLLTTVAIVSSAQETGNAQQETNQQQQQQQAQNQAAIATISVVNNKDESANAIVNEPTNAVVHAFSPRLDYSNEWRPVGRGDPLKNDPTFDYSPPTLEHVRYWAETTKDSGSKEDSGSGKQDANSVRFAHPNKQDILLLGMSSEHLVRGGGSTHASQAPHQHSHASPHTSQQPQQQPYHQPHPGAMKNAKGETPLLQPKYTSVRRSYYAQQLPTRLMPPPMQALNSSPINTFNVPMKPSQAHTEYRHSMSAAPLHISSKPSMGPSSTASVSHMKTQHYPSMSTSSSSPWMYSSLPSMQYQQHHHYDMSRGPAASIPTSSQSSRMPLHHGYDSHPQDSHHYFSYTRPSPNSVSSHPPQESYSPNSLRYSANNHKQTGTGRKPWLHELLQKEVVKTTPKPNYSATPNKFVHGSTKPIYERMPSTNAFSGGFTPFTPVTFVPAPPTIETMTTTTTTTTHMPQPQSNSFTTSAFYPTTSTTSAPSTTSAKAYIIYTTANTTTTPRTTTSTTSSRLLIPTSSNLAYRPTVAPMQMTTDSLFSHYKQPETPLRGPMYLIIEGHSKVKKYGKNGINLNLPKIVPVIPKREPVVRMAEPGGEKRGTPETFHVEHLHVRTSTTTTTARSPVKPITSTTAKPVTSAPITKLSTTLKPSMSASNATQTTLKPLTTSTTTTARPAATTTARKAISTIAATPQTNPTAAFAKTPSTATKLQLNEPLLKLELPTDPPTGMQGLLSLLDSSLSGLFAEQPLDLTDTPASAPTPPHLSQTKQVTTANNYVTTPSTILQPINLPMTTAQAAVVPVAPDARVGTNAGDIVAADTDQPGSAEFSFTTDKPPREVRQVYDYDQRPESRLKDFVIESFDGEGEEGASAFYEDEFEEYADDDAGDDDHDDAGNQQPIKRIDKFAVAEEGEFVGDYEDVELGELGLGDVVPHANSASFARTQAKKA